MSSRIGYYKKRGDDILSTIIPIFDKCNSFFALIATIGTVVLGQHWWLFLAYLLLNIGDCFTGWLKSAIAGKTSSVRGMKGIAKKFGYWVMIALSFGIGAILIEVGEIIEIDLGITIFLGWFVLLSLIVNEVRSIIENFVEAGYKVPDVLTRGLYVANKLIEDASHSIGDIPEEHQEEPDTELNHTPESSLDILYESRGRDYEQ